GGGTQAVVERLLFVARVGAGAVDIPPVRLDDVARDAVEQTQALSYAADLTVEVTTEPVTIQADSDRLLEAITNVITNAIRYNVKGGRVDVTAGPDHGGAVLRVADSGIGIAPADLDHVFE